MTAARFGFVGEARSDKPIVLTMGLGFVTRLGDKADEIKEPSIDISRSKEWRPFEIQFDRGDSGRVLERLNLSIDMYGVAATQFRNLRLVQYPAASPIAGDISFPALDQAAQIIGGAFMPESSFLIGCDRPGSNPTRTRRLCSLPYSGGSTAATNAKCAASPRSMAEVSRGGPEFTEGLDHKRIRSKAGQVLPTFLCLPRILRLIDFLRVLRASVRNRLPYFGKNTASLSSCHASVQPGAATSFP